MMVNKGFFATDYRVKAAASRNVMRRLRRSFSREQRTRKNIPPRSSAILRPSTAKIKSHEYRFHMPDQE
jgi:hypothetical protein